MSKRTWTLERNIEVSNTRPIEERDGWAGKVRRNVYTPSQQERDARGLGRFFLWFAAIVAAAIVIGTLIHH
jgi:hypothetical protein